MAGLPVFRISKIKARGASTPRSVMGHLARTRETMNADTSRRHLNKWLVGSAALDLEVAVWDRIAAAGIHPPPVATVAVEVLLTASADLFRPDEAMGVGEYDRVVVRRFVDAALMFLRGNFDDRLLCAVLHLDEATPHIHGITVPLLPPRKRKTPRLSAKDMFNRTELRRMQGQWEDLLQPLGCGPRLIRSASHHFANARYHATVSEVSQQVESFRLEPLPDATSDKLADRRAIEEWYERLLLHINETLVPLGQAAIYGRMYEAQARQTRRLRELLDLAKERLVGAAREIDERLDLTIQRDAVEVQLSMRLDAGPVLAQICRSRNLSPGKAVDLVATKIGLDTALSIVVESSRPHLERVIAQDREEFSDEVNQPHSEDQGHPRHH